MKKNKLKQGVKDVLGILLFYLILVLGIIALNARFEYLNQQKSAIEPDIQIAQNKQPVIYKNN